MKKKFFFCLLSMILCFSLCINALAVGIDVSQESDVKIGDIFAVDVRLSEALTVKSGGVYVDYDPDVLSVEGYEWHFAANPMIKYFDASTGVGVFAYMTPTTVSDLIFTVTFKVIDNAAYGDSPVTVRMSFKDNVNPDNDIITDDVIVNIGVICSEHNPGAAATCTTGQVCTECGYILKPAKGHVESEKWSSDGISHWKVCSVEGCGILIENSDAEHNSTGTNKATCTDKAICDVCGQSYGDIAPDNHDIVKYDGNAPTCVDSGYKAYEECTRCDYTTYEEIPATGAHAGGSATCTDKAICDVCGQSYGDIAPDNHDIVKYDGKAPTCVGIGYKAYESCTRCDYTTYEEIPATGAHAGGSATCTDKAICDVCGQSYGDIAPDNHTETEIRNAVEATGTTDGYTGDTYCKDCNTKLSDGEVIPKLSVPGDVNGDGKVNLNDVSLILKNIAKWNVTMDADAADVNDDGKVNLNDVSLILKYIAKWDITLK